MSAEKYGPDYKMDVFTLSGHEALTLWTELSAGIESGTTIRVGIDGGLKIDTGRGEGWSLPMGTDATGRS